MKCVATSQTVLSFASETPMIWTVSVEEYEEHFERKEVQPRPTALSSRKSALSLQLEEFEQTVNNPFMEYAKFDGRVSN